MPRKQIRPGALALLTACWGALCPMAAKAQTTDALPLWEIGAFATGFSQQAYPGASQRIDRALVLPFFIYRGKFLRADQETVGLRALKTDTVEVDIGFGGAFGSNSNDIEARRGMPDLGTLVEFGPRVKWKLGNTADNTKGHTQDNTRSTGRLRAEVALRGVFDLSDSLRDKGITLEPELIYEHDAPGGWRYSTSLGLVFGDTRLADTFYGVAPAYATASRAAYSASAGLIASRISLAVTRTLSANVRIFGFARAALVDGAANQNSPLVRQNTGATLGLGLTYIFARSTISSTY